MLNIPRRTVHILLSKEGLLMKASVSVVICDAAQIEGRMALEMKDGVALTLPYSHSASD